jgi:hypothetical protein
MDMYVTKSQWFQIFQYDGTYFTNIQDKRVLDVKDANDEKEAQPVIVSKRQASKSKNDALNQKWRVVYVDKAEAIETKGLNDE